MSDPTLPLITPEVKEGTFIPVSLDAKYSVNSFKHESFFGRYRLAGRYFPDEELQNGNEYVHELDVLVFATPISAPITPPRCPHALPRRHAAAMARAAPVSAVRVNRSLTLDRASARLRQAPARRIGRFRCSVRSQSEKHAIYQ